MTRGEAGVLLSNGSPVTLTATVERGLCDDRGRLPLSQHVALIAEAGLALLQHVGLDRQTALELGLVLPDSRFEIDLLRDCIAGESIEIRSAVAELGSSWILWLHEVLVGPQHDLALRCTVRTVCRDSADGTIAPVPAPLRDALRPVELIQRSRVA